MIKKILLTCDNDTIYTSADTQVLRLLLWTSDLSLTTVKLSTKTTLKSVELDTKWGYTLKKDGRIFSTWVETIWRYFILITARPAMWTIATHTRHRDRGVINTSLRFQHTSYNDHKPFFILVLLRFCVCVISTTTVL